MLEQQKSQVRLLADFGPNLSTRINQAFPDLKSEEIARLRRFGGVKRYADGERMFQAGKPRGGMFVMLKGSVAVALRDGPFWSKGRDNSSPKSARWRTGRPSSTVMPGATSRRW